MGKLLTEAEILEALADAQRWQQLHTLYTAQERYQTMLRDEARELALGWIKYIDSSSVEEMFQMTLQLIERYFDHIHYDGLIGQREMYLVVREAAESVVYMEWDCDDMRDALENM